MTFGPNPWDSLMVCGFSWEEAKSLIWYYAQKEGVWLPKWNRGKRKKQ